MANVARPLPEGTVTVLFTDVEGSTALTSRLGDEPARALLRSIENTIREQIEVHHGVNVKGLGDGIMGAFQSARRAIECSVAIQRELDRRPSRGDTPLRVRIGLNTGEVIHEREDLFGSAVNAAQRIESAAEPGTILISATTRALLGQTTDLRLTDRGPTELKGFDEPWTLFEVHWRTRAGIAPGESSPFVGREREYGRLVGLVERAVGGGSLVFVGGEPGIGKSRLTEEVCHEARTRGVLVLVGHCQEEGRQPYLPFVEMLERAAEIVPPDAFREALGPNAPEVAKLMPELRTRYDDIPEPVPLPPDQERRFMLGSIRDFLARAASAQPMLLVFEDVQWADESTLLLLRRLSQRIGQMRLVVIATYRDVDLEARHPLIEMAQDLVRQRYAEEILLDTLDRADVAGLLERIAGSTPPEHVTALVFDETEGNPFFVEELYRHLIESGKLFDAGGNWIPTLELAADEVPRGVRLLVERRIQRLTDDCRGALVYGALSGRTFSYDVLGSLVDIDDDRLLDAVEEAERAGVIREASRGRDTRYSFVHEQFRQTLIGTVSSPRRQRMHRKIGDVLEAAYGDDAPRHVDELAHHFYEAGSAADPTKAGRYLTLAAERALSALAYEDAVWYLDAAETADSKAGAEVRARRLHLHALALRGLGRIDDAFANFEQALELADGNGEHDKILRSRAELSLGLFRGNEAVRDFQLLIDNAKAAGDAEAELHGLLGLGYAYYVVALNNPERASSARETLDRAYELGKQLGDKVAMARALIRTMYFTDFWPEYASTASANVQEAIELAEETGDEGLILDALIAGLAYRQTSSPRERAEEYDRLRARLERRRDPLRLKEHYFHGMWLYRGVARFADAVELCDAAIAIADELGVPPVMYPTLKALSLLDLGRFDEAGDALQQEITDEPFGHAFRELGRAQHLCELKRYDEAAPLARNVADMMQDLGRVLFRAMALGIYARSLIASGADLSPLEDVRAEIPPDARTEVRIARGDTVAALERLERVTARAAENGDFRGAIVAGEARVRTLLELGRGSEAVTQAGRWLEMAVASDFRTVVWKLYALRAKARRREGDEPGAAEDLASAAEVIRALADGIAHEEQRARFLGDSEIASTLTLGVET